MNNKCSDCKFSHVLKGTVKIQEEDSDPVLSGSESESVVETAFCYWASMKIGPSMSPVFVQAIEDCNRYEKE